jgi:hypothetical protein
VSSCAYLVDPPDEFLANDDGFAVVGDLVSSDLGEELDDGARVDGERREVGSEEETEGILKLRLLVWRGDPIARLVWWWRVGGVMGRRGMRRVGGRVGGRVRHRSRWIGGVESDRKRK